jgi:hypothetical protein
VDPEAPEQRAVVDVDEAPRNAQGLVEFTARAIVKAAQKLVAEGFLLKEDAERIVQAARDGRSPYRHPSTE